MSYKALLKFNEFGAVGYPPPKAVPVPWNGAKLLGFGVKRPPAWLPDDGPINDYFFYKIG